MKTSFCPSLKNHPQKLLKNIGYALLYRTNPNLTSTILLGSTFDDINTTKETSH